MAGDDPGGSVPRPDPTLLTSTAVAQAKEDLRREIQALHDIADARISALEAELQQTWARHKGDIAIEAVQREALRASVLDKFAERDLRFAQGDADRKEALAAALRTARELVDTKAEAAQNAADKFQEAIVRQFADATRANRDSRDRLAAQVAELEKRLATEAGATTGSTQSRDALRLNVGVLIAGAALVVSLILGILLYAKK